MCQEGMSGKPTRLLFESAAVVLVFAICLNSTVGVLAQDLEQRRIVMAPKPVGSGARALGQSAFIAVADDATAASWNPAGLINIESAEASFVGAWKDNTNDYSVTTFDVSAEPGSWERWEANFLSYAQPFRIGNKDAVLSVNYHQVYDFNLDLDYVAGPLTVEGASTGAVSAYSLAGAVSVPCHPRIALGTSVNWYTQSWCYNYAWKRQLTSTDQYGSLEYTETFDDFQGYNFTFGLFWDVYEKEERLLTLGFVCHTPFTAEMKVEQQWQYPGQGGFGGSYRQEMDFPLSLGTGANCRLSDTLSIAADVEWKEWSEFEQKDLQTGERTSPIGGGTGDISDTLAFRIGFEQLKLPKHDGKWVRAVRAGLLYEPRPALDDAMDVYGVSLGLGWTLKKTFSLDFAYQFRRGEDVSGGNLGQGLEGFDYRIEEHFLVGSFIRYF